ncbi:MAG: hypothetical protein U9N82_01000 [Thermodesulfobacteriota bacterium]|nr:hypothetical protein [Thermodesulfobacteriota bacterium]
MSITIKEFAGKEPCDISWVTHVIRLKSRFKSGKAEGAGRTRLRRFGGETPAHRVLRRGGVDSYIPI